MQKPTLNNTIINFWSTPEIYKKEKKGIKPNTVRYHNRVEPKFIMLREGKAKFIRIHKTHWGNRKGKYIRTKPEYFTRKIKDVTYWKRLVIISW